jgi:hypothetical protein
MKKIIKPSEDIMRAMFFNTGHGFVIHGAIEKPFFPTHTHGLTEMGMPEFIFDPLAFGAQGNAKRILDAYKYLSKLEKSDELEDLRCGITIRVTANDLIPEFTGDHPYDYCLRKVSPDFEGVKLAYYPGETDPEMWFVQMYTEGDDYVLTDEYYRYGVRW